ncbi:MAG: hypothetical protein ACYCOU_04185 [Sulfobacillus sp.]
MSAVGDNRAQAHEWQAPCYYLAEPERTDEAPTLNPPPLTKGAGSCLCACACACACAGKVDELLRKVSEYESELFRLRREPNCCPDRRLVDSPADGAENAPSGMPDMPQYADDARYNSDSFIDVVAERPIEDLSDMFGSSGAQRTENEFEIVPISNAQCSS